MVSLRSLPLERFSQVHAVALLLACPLVALARQPWPLVFAAVLTFGAVLVSYRSRYTPSGSFGAANVLTGLRLGAVLALAMAGRDVSSREVALVVATVMVLDGVDGVVARRSGTASEFGAHFDVEVDALLVLVLGAVLWQRGRLGPWILWPGLLRYVYVLVLAVTPARGQAPRSLLGRLGFGAIVAGLLGAFLDSGDAGTLAAVGGTVLVTLSFVRSFYFSYRPSSR
jgi:phosphatidylglycerophosphate synthase